MAIRLGHDGDDFAETHEINVTPFIDVILVLLIIFMIAAPLATVDVPVDLPSTTAERQQRPDKPVFLTVKQDLTLALGNEEVPRATLQATLDRQTGNDREPRVFLRADGTVAYNELMKVMNLLRAPAISRSRWSALRIPDRPRRQARPATLSPSPFRPASARA